MSPPTRWRYLTGDGVGAAAGLAADEAMMLRYGRGEAAPATATLRLYGYRAHCALVGRYQSLADEVDLDYCRAHGVETGRRPTGGGAILMGPGQLGVALAARAAPEETPRQSLERWAGGVVAGLAALGVEARFRAKNDLETGGRKIAGLGLYLDPRGAVLFHASVLVDLDVALMLRVLNIPGAKLSDKALARVEERVTTVSRELGRGLAAADVRPAFAAAFARACGVELVPGVLDAAERARQAELEGRRYGNDRWTFQASERQDARGSALLKSPEGLLRIFVGVHGPTLKSVLVAGDYNVLPAGVVRLENRLRWSRARRDDVLAAARECLCEEDLGLDATVVGEAVWRATENALELQRRAHPVRAEGSCYFPEPGAEGSVAGPLATPEETP